MSLNTSNGSKLAFTLVHSIKTYLGGHYRQSIIKENNSMTSNC